MCEQCIVLVTSILNPREMTAYQRERWAAQHLRRTLALVGLNEAVRGSRPSARRGPQHGRLSREVQWSSRTSN